MESTETKNFKVLTSISVNVTSMQRLRLLQSPLMTFCMETKKNPKLVLVIMIRDILSN